MAAYKEAFVKEALSGLRGVYSSKLSLIPVKEMVDTVTVVKQTKIAKEGGWAKVKRGKYKGDIGRVASLCRLPLPPLFAASRCRRPVARPLSASLCRISFPRAHSREKPWCRSHACAAPATLCLGRARQVMSVDHNKGEVEVKLVPRVDTNDYSGKLSLP